MNIILLYTILENWNQVRNEVLLFIIANGLKVSYSFLDLWRDAK